MHGLQTRNAEGTSFHVHVFTQHSTIPLFHLHKPMNETNESLKELRRRLENLLGRDAFKMVLFGSRARGDYDDDSDVDVAILVRGLTREMKRRILDEVAEFELENLLPISALVLSEKDFGHLKARERRIAMDIEREGIPL